MASADLPYYDFNKILSRNGTFNMVVGGRGLGKTYGFKNYAIRDFIKRGNQFIYVRRYKSELKNIKTFFADIAPAFPDWELRVNGWEFQCRAKEDGDKAAWKTMGWAVPLSVAGTQKSVSYPRVTKIGFDEFIIDKGKVQYLPGETEAFQEFYSTVDRWQDKTRVYFLANSVSIMNPYFVDYDIEPHGEEWITKADGFLVAHFPDSAAFASEVYKTKFGKFIQGTEYANYSVGNEFADNNTNLVAAKSMTAQYQFTLETKAGTFSVWYDQSDPRREDGPVFYIETKRPRAGERINTMIYENMAEDRTFLEYGHRYLSLLRTSYAKGLVFFASPKARNAFAGLYKR